MSKMIIRAIRIDNKVSWQMLSSVLLTLFLSVYAQGEPVVDAASRLDQAGEYLSRDQYTQAEQLYREVSEQNAGTDYDLQARKGLAITYAAQKRDSEVDTVVDRLIADFPAHQDTSQAVCNVGDRYYAMQDFARARQLFSRTVNACPLNAFSMWAQCGIANSSLRLGENSVAEAATAKLIADYSEQDEIAMAACLIAENYHQLNKRAKADDLFQMIAERWPQDEYPMWSRMHLTVSDIKQGKEVVAETAIAKLINDYSSQKDIPIALCLIADDYYKLDQRTRADALCKMVSETWPHHDYPVWSGMRLAMFYIDEGDIVMAESMVNNLFANYSNHQHFIRAACYIAGRYYDRRAFEQANQLYQHIADRHPEAVQKMWPQVVSLIVNVRLIGDDIPPGSIDKIQADYVSHSELSEAVFWLGEIYYKDGSSLKQKGLSDLANVQFQKAMAVWNRMKNPDLLGPAYYGIGLCYRELGDYAKAADALQKSYQADPTFQYADYCLFENIRCHAELAQSGKITHCEAFYNSYLFLDELVEQFPDSKYYSRGQQWLSRCIEE